MNGWAAIARMGGLGDNLVASSPFRPLKRLGYKTEIITSRYFHTVFLNNPFIDRVTVKDEGDIPAGEQWQLWFRSRAKEYDIFAHLSHSMEGRHALNVGATGFSWPPEYRRKMCAGSYLETAHDIVGVPHEFGPLFHATEDEQEKAERTKKKVGPRYLGWVMGGSRVDKMYPFTSHAVSRIVKELGIPVVLFGIGDKQAKHAEMIQKDIQRTNSTDKNLHLAMTSDIADKGGSHDWSVRRSLSMIMTADLVITPDTGLGWGVAMEPMPKILLHSHASVENIAKHWVNTTSLHADPYRVPCWPCHQLHDTIDTCVPAKDSGGAAAACIADIQVETILLEVARLWNPNVVRLEAAE